ncbi:MAG: universal stress protein, partial [Cyanobacteria bacterium J06621_11]
LRLIHVLSSLHPADPAAMWDSPSDDERKQKVKESLSDKLKDAGFPELSIEVAIGDVAGEVVDYAEAIKADLIVMPSHGYKGAKRFLIGSVAERVVRLSPCPVLILK